MTRSTTTWTNKAALSVAMIAGLLTCGGCDYLNPLGGGGDGTGASGEVPTKQKSKQKAGDEETGQQNQQAGRGESAQADTGVDTGEDRVELTVPEPEGGDDSDQPARNPFEPKIQTEDDEKTETTTEPTEPLQRYSLGQLELAAIISGVAVPKAMFITPDKMGHLVQEGDSVGQEGGEIVDIRSNAVELSIPQGPDEPPRTRTVELAARGVGSAARPGGEELSEEEQEMLDRLMQSEEGREAVRERYRGSSQQGQSPPSGQSGGVQPPGGG